MKVSIIIPVLNQWDLTHACLLALKKTIPPKWSREIFVCDGGSTDETASQLPHFSDIEHLKTKSTPANFAQNCNFGARHATGEFLVFLNNDTVPQPHWLEPMIAVAEAETDAGLIGNVQWNPRRNWWDHFGIVFESDGTPHHFGQYSRKNLFLTGYGEWSAVTAACCLIRRSLFIENGGFDETYRNGCEDIDLSLRLRRLGYRNLVAYESHIEHVKCATPGRKEKNRQNLKIFQKRWSKSIAANEALHDRHKCALTIWRKFLKYPWTLSARQLAQNTLPLFSSPKQEPEPR
ncbi:MAG: glycosyltransferase family 2 protein [Opitutales bacterium]|nr:glycosyltransferase family 2 protein [Opitutales bacterium]MCH8539383.1 glycosyltransferase family 2 protein [Opitutales bacterium]